MTTQEFSNTFDTLLNSYRDVKAFGQTSSAYSLELDEYEKSILLTQAQDIIVKSYFDRSLNNQGTGFDDNSKRQIDFSELVNVGLGVDATEDALQFMKFDERSKLYVIPSNILFILNEKVTVNKGGLSQTNMVIPINYQEYDRLTSKPYGQPLKRQCWRFLHKLDGYSKQVEVLTITQNHLDPVNTTVDLTLNGEVFKVPIVLATGTLSSVASVTELFYLAVTSLNLTGWTITTNQLNTITFTSKYSNKCADPIYSNGIVTGSIETTIEGGTKTADSNRLIVEVIPRNDIDSIGYYKIRYVRRPVPIVLSDLSGGEFDTPLDIDGVSVETQCELSPIIHMDILNKAVELALNRVGVNTTGDKDSKSNK